MSQVQAVQRAGTEPSPKHDWREDYAYSLGVQAYIYGFPYLYMSEVRWGQVAQKVDPILPHAAVNHFWHNQVMGGPESQAGGSPNNDLGAVTESCQRHARWGSKAASLIVPDSYEALELSLSSASRRPAWTYWRRSTGAVASAPTNRAAQTAA